MKSMYTEIKSDYANYLTMALNKAYALKRNAILIIYGIAIAMVLKGINDNGLTNKVLWGGIGLLTLMSIPVAFIASSKIEKFVPKKVRNELQNNMRFKLVQQFFIEKEVELNFHPLKKKNLKQFKHSGAFPSTECQTSEHFDIKMDSGIISITHILVLKGLKKVFKGIMISIETAGNPSLVNSIESIFNSKQIVKRIEKDNSTYLFVKDKHNYLNIPLKRKTNHFEGFEKDLNQIYKLACLRVGE